MCFGQIPSPKVTSFNRKHLPVCLLPFELLLLWESVQEKAVTKQPPDRLH